MQVNSKLLMGDIKNAIVPELSIMIPTYGRATYLEKAIDSAISQKSKKCTYEVVVVSNDPNDAMEHLIAKYGNTENLFIYRNEQNLGMVGNSNRCVDLARGKYVAFLHDDDYLLENYLETIETYFINKQENIKCFIVGRYLLFEKKDKEYRNAVIKDYMRKIYFIPDLYRRKLRIMKLKYNLYANQNCYFSPSCGTIFEKEAFNKVGGFNSDIPYAWDYEFFLRFNKKFQINVFSDACAVYRIGGNASLRSEVKFDFFDYNRTEYLRFMRENNIDDKFVNKYEKEIVYSIFQQWPEELEQELVKRDIEVPNVKSKMKWRWFKLKTLLYYYNNNLDIQRLMPKNMNT